MTRKVFETDQHIKTKAIAVILSSYENFTKSENPEGSVSDMFKKHASPLTQFSLTEAPNEKLLFM